MSRPFSYNDDNFTVIGNVLFCHILTAPATGKFIIDGTLDIECNY